MAWLEGFGSRLAVEGTRQCVWSNREAPGATSAHMRPKSLNNQTQHISTNGSATVRETRNESATEKETSVAMVHVRSVYVIGSQVASNAFISIFSMSQGSPEPQPTNYSDATESFLKKGQKAGVWLLCAFSVFFVIHIKSRVLYFSKLFDLVHSFLTVIASRFLLVHRTSSVGGSY